MVILAGCQGQEISGTSPTGNPAGQVPTGSPEPGEPNDESRAGEVLPSWSDNTPCAADSDCDGPWEAVDSCSTPACDLLAGLCVLILSEDGTSCDDSDVCTSASSCDGGTCIGDIEEPCADDGNPCTDDVCDPTYGCQYLDNKKTCDDGDLCTTEDLCGVGVCRGVPTVCPGEGCFCDPDSGGCVCPIPCEPTDCDDGNPCTADTCDPVDGCLHSPTDEGEPCDDGDACTLETACDTGTCACGDGCAAPDCDDGNPCTADTCDPIAG
ncbi:MAG: hypothetical protein VX938_13855, partial [Myxococcota bacterium]|nr:hypothetical protein [Myxococcota bacterium]